MTIVRDDPLDPDPAFAELYARLPDVTNLWPWLELAQAARPPVLYLGVGAGRIAVPLHDAGIELVGVDSHPGMLARLRQRLPAMELVESRIEVVNLARDFDLVIAPSNILFLVERLRAAARQLSSDGALAIELTNPHWLRAGAGEGVRVLALDGNEARVEVDYRLADGPIVTQRATIALVWPEEAESWLATGAGLRLRRLFGHRDAELDASPSFYLVAGR
jgi:trans-aconitate methyltransferase